MSWLVRSVTCHHLFSKFVTTRPRQGSRIEFPCSEICRLLIKKNSCPKGESAQNFRFLSNRHFGGEWISKSCFASWFSCQRVAGRASPWLRRRRRMRWLQLMIVSHIVWHLQSIIPNTDIKVMMFIRWRQSPTPSATQRASSYPQFPRWASLHFPFLNRIVSVFCEGAGDALKEKVSTLHIFSRADYCMLRSFGVDVCWNLDWMHPDEDVGKHLATDLLLILIQEERPLGRCWVSDEKTFFALVLKMQNWNCVMLLSEVTCK